MAKILVTGSSTGLGFFAAEKLIAQGHQVVVHARNHERADELRSKLPDVAAIVQGDLAYLEQTRDIARQVNQYGPMDAVIYNAGIYGSRQKVLTEQGINETFAVNVLAPYLLTALIERPNRLVFLSSSMHFGANHHCEDLSWEQRRWNNTAAYSESKFYDTLLACAIARIWPDVYSNSVDPGWVPTRMGGQSASDDLDMGSDTQVYLATSNEPSAKVSGCYFHHMRQQQPDPKVHDRDLQQQLLECCGQLTQQSLD